MHIPCNAPKASARGYSITELLVALAAGAIVLTSVAVYTVSATRGYAQIVQDARVTRQMTQIMDQIASTIRGSGYHADAARSAASFGADSPSSDSPVIRSPTCAVAQMDTTGVTDGEYRGFRYVLRHGIGVIQTTPWSRVEPDCLAPVSASDWRDMTDLGVVDVLDLSFTPTPGLGACAVRRDFIVAAQGVDIRVRARSPETGSVVRTLDRTIDVRNDIMATGNCI